MPRLVVIADQKQNMSELTATAQTQSPAASDASYIGGEPKIQSALAHHRSILGLRPQSLAD